uniref:Uncharacterized protein n=1 Tax=viral metagenome TaxID=1070528 RepID=A0A6C0ERQ8_9ZZZZ
MKITKKSKQLMNFFTKNNYINHNTQTKQTKTIISDLYKDIIESYQYLLNLKKTKNNKPYNVTVKNIESVSQISKPQYFNANSFPQEVRKHIDEFSTSEISYNFSLYERNIKIIFVLEEDNVELKIETYNKYIDSIIMWLHIVNKYSSKECSNTLIVYLYFTTMEKQLPTSSIHILDETNINTAFTTTCPKDSEIVVFRKEEWFKVLMHETFHNFGLDFSDMTTTESTKQILKIFPVNSQVNLYESYTEFWAEIMNALFCSFFTLKDKNNIDEFLSNSEFFINFERTYSFFQLVKTLHFMGISYEDLYSKNDDSKILRETMYKEKTNVLAYYVIKNILMNNYQGFLYWCKTHNFLILQFKKTLTNQKEYCKFIEKNYKTKSMLESVNNTEKLMKLFYTNNNKTNNKSNNQNIYKFITNNLRMSICELG